MDKDDIFASVHSVVFKESETLEGKCLKIQGYDFNQGVNYPQLLKSFISTGFQASYLGEAIDVVNQMIGDCQMRYLLKIAVRKRGILSSGNLLGAKYSWVLPRILSLLGFVTPFDILFSIVWLMLL